ncbi:MAG: twin-arginine translocation signal domain-containing protein [Candidatus Omnitrophica bacterium]|nr:twin-arginine translocation signal domain-containing protein [Candidatus Omnitrophota bacterium]
MRLIKSFNVLVNIMIVVFVIQTIFMPVALAQGASTVLPGSVSVSGETFKPLMLQGVNIYPNDPFLLKFIVNQGDSRVSDEDLRKQSEQLIKYFLASLTVPEKEMWVNLSPYEKDRIIPDGFGKTTMGHDLLAQDYVLKQMASALMNPEKELGQKFWSQVYSKAKEQFGTTDIPLDTFNKVWIVPEGAVIYEHEKGALIIKSHLKVMQEEDYLALEANKNSTEHGLGSVTVEDLKKGSTFSSAIMREIFIPEITREVNEGKAFANLRQIYHSLLLANWYKKRLQESLLAKVYSDKSKTNGVHIPDPAMNKRVYEQYVSQFNKGAFNYIKEDVDPVTQEITPRKYFSGGADFTHEAAMIVKKVDGKLPDGEFSAVDAKLALSRRSFLKFSGAAVLAAFGLGAPLAKAGEPVAAAAKAAALKPTYSYPPELALFGEGLVPSGLTKGLPLNYAGEEAFPNPSWTKTGTKMSAVLEFGLIQQREHGDFTIINSLVAQSGKDGLFFFRGNKYFALNDSGRRVSVRGLPLELVRTTNRTAKDKWWETWDWGVNVADASDMINLAIDAYNRTTNATYKKRYLAFVKRLAITLTLLQDKTNGGLRYGPMGVYYFDPQTGKVDSNYFYNLKTTESNLRALYAYLNLYDVTQDQRHLDVALNIWKWLIGMYNGGAAVFHEAEKFYSAEWEKTPLGTDQEQFNTMTTALAPISLMLYSNNRNARAAFGGTLEERIAVVEEMLAATNRRVAFTDQYGVAGYARSGEEAGHNMLSPAVSSEMALFLLELSAYYQDIDATKAAEYRRQYAQLMGNIGSFFDDYRGGRRIAPDAIDVTTGGAAPRSVGWTASLSSGTAFSRAQKGGDYALPGGWNGEVPEEQAMISSPSGNVNSYGGIDLNPAIGNTKIERNTNGIVIPVAAINSIDAHILSGNFTGFTPVIQKTFSVADLSTLVGTK